MKVFNDLKTRGAQDMLIAVTDGLQGMEQALGAGVFADDAIDLHRAFDPQQLLDREAFAAALKPVYTAASAEMAQAALDAFDSGCVLATGLGARHFLLYVPAGHTQSGLHDQSH